MCAKLDARGSSLANYQDYRQVNRQAHACHAGESMLGHTGTDRFPFSLLRDRPMSLFSLTCQGRLPLLGLIVGGMLSLESVALATGRWNMPGTIPQFFGYGNGPGYHAPRMRKPRYCPAKVPHPMHGHLRARFVDGHGEDRDVRETTNRSIPVSRMGATPNRLPMPQVPAVANPKRPTASTEDEPRFPSRRDSRLVPPSPAPISLADLLEFDSAPVSPAPEPSENPLPEEPETARSSDRTEESPPSPSGAISRDLLFSAPFLPADQG